MNLRLAVVSLTGLLLLLGLQIYRQWPDDYFHLIMCDVGQGDATLLTQGFTQVLIDSGKDDQVVNCLANNLPFWDRNLELVIATHADSDHIGGFEAVGERYHFAKVMLEPLGKETELFQGFSELISRKQQAGTQVIFPRVGTELEVGSLLHVSVISPRDSPYLESPQSSQLSETQLWDSWVEGSEAILTNNDRSIVLLGIYHHLTFLLTGDLEAIGEQALLDKGVLADIDILKVGHHGSKTSTITQFLQVTRPEIALISSGKNNQYGHPAPEVLKKIEEIGAKIMRTDQKGEIHLMSDGEHVWLLKCLSLLCHTF